MATRNFNVKNGLTAGNITLDATTNTTTTSILVVTSNANIGNLSVGNGAGGSLTGANLVSANFFTGTLTTASQPNITSVGTLTSLAVTGNITAGGNIVGTFANGNSTITIPAANGNINLNAGGVATPELVVTTTGANITGTLNVTGNANVGNLGTTRILATANITAPQLISNVATGTAPLVVTSNTQVPNLHSALAGTVTTAAQPNITSVGTLTTLNVSGNAVVGGNLIVDGNIVYVNVDTLTVEDPIIQLQSGPNGGPPVANSGKDVGVALNYFNIVPRVGFMGWDVSNVEFGLASLATITDEVVTFSSYGNLRVGNIIGNGQALTSIPAGNITGQVANALVSGTVYTAAQPNITSVGTLTSLAVSGNLIAANLSGVFANGNSNVNIPSANGNINLSVAGNANVLVVTGTGVNVAGSLNAVNLVSTGNANLATLSVASNAVYANSTRLVLGSGVGLQANGSLGISGQVLTSNGNSTFWGNKGATIATTAPTTANQGDMWWDTDIGTLFIYYNDGISTQWVEAVPQILIETTPNVYQLNGSLVVTNDLTVQGTLFETSDISLKKNIETFSNALDTVEKLRGVEFDWKNTDKHSAGVIAQELETVLPYLVSNSDGIKSVNYTAIIGVLIEAIKELSDKVDKSCQ